MALALTLHEGAVPPTINQTQRDPECDLDYIPNVGRENVKVDTVMSNSFAFGGTSGVLIARKV